MAGGRGTRLASTIKGEKPLLLLLGKPLIAYTIDALKQTADISSIHAITSPHTPETAQWLHTHHPEIEVIKTPGKGYVPDMVRAVRESKVRGFLLLVMADLPLITPELLEEVIHTHRRAGTDALSVHLPFETCRELGLRPDTVFNRNGRLIVPVGINIINADKIDLEQEDHNYILTHPVLNVNTPEDYRICERLLQRRR